MRKAKLPRRVKTVEDLLSLDAWHQLTASLAEQEGRAVYALLIIRGKAGDIDVAGTGMSDAQAVLMLEEAKKQILDWRQGFNS